MKRKSTLLPLLVLLLAAAMAPPAAGQITRDDCVWGCEKAVDSATCRAGTGRHRECTVVQSCTQTGWLFAQGIWIPVFSCTFNCEFTYCYWA